jgi:urease accessory protein
MAVLAQMVTAWERHDVERLTTLSQWVHATRESAELRLQAEQMGRSMLEWLRNQGQIDADTVALCNQLVPTYPLMFGLALSRTGAPLDQCLQAYAFGWAENMVQAALKSVPLGQNSGQRILAQLAQHIAPSRGACHRKSQTTRDKLFLPCWPSCQRNTKLNTPDCLDHEHTAPHSPTAPKNCRPCAWALAAPSALAKPPC